MNRSNNKNIFGTLATAVRQPPSLTHINPDGDRRRPSSAAASHGVISVNELVPRQGQSTYLHLITSASDHHREKTDSAYLIRRSLSREAREVRGSKPGASSLPRAPASSSSRGIRRGCRRASSTSARERSRQRRSDSTTSAPM